MSVITWLIVHVWPTALRTTVSAVTGAIVAAFILAPMRGAMRLLRKRVSHVLDSLDPDVPVGLTEQMNDVQKQLQGLNDHMDNDTIKVRQAEPVEIKAPRGHR